ncbi:hypothetical protein [Streptomyces sp. enrichment culture]|uniref:hypothetical protein n=1 Tax=Streptomyces sp. enrichment culture TaxID=1795815 RepID=UPI003F56AC2A
MTPVVTLDRARRFPVRGRLGRRRRPHADPDGDMTLLGVFNPPLRGTERHTLHREQASSC